MTERYDAIVVGAGTAGLFCANFLARYGKKTLLLEHNHQPGGLTGGFRRRKFYFDAGDQSFESGGIVLPLLKNLGLYRRRDWSFADYTMAYEHGSVVMKDPRRALTELVDLFPDQRREMSALFSHMMQCAEIMGSLSNDRNSPIDKTGLARLHSIADLGRAFLSHRREIREMMSVSIPELYRRYLPPSDYRERMCNTGYRDMPVGMGAGFWFTWFEDYWHYNRGLQGLMDDLAGSFREHGGVLHCNQTVDGILTEHGAVRGVSTRDGNEYHANRVVFAGAMKRLYTELIGPELVHPSLQAEIQKAPLSEPLVALYLGVDMSHEELGPGPGLRRGGEQAHARVRLHRDHLDLHARSGTGPARQELPGAADLQRVPLDGQLGHRRQRSRPAREVQAPEEDGGGPDARNRLPPHPGVEGPGRVPCPGLPAFHHPVHAEPGGRFLRVESRPGEIIPPGPLVFPDHARGGAVFHRPLHLLARRGPHGGPVGCLRGTDDQARPDAQTPAMGGGAGAAEPVSGGTGERSGPGLFGSRPFFC